MTEQEFNNELYVIKPQVARVPFIWSILKKWFKNHADDVLILLLKRVFTSAKSPIVRALAGDLIALLESKDEKDQ